MRRYILILLTVVIILLSGCSSREVKRELDSLSVVLGIGIDKSESEEENMVDITVQVVRTGSVKSGGDSSSSGQQGEPFWNLSLQGDEIFTALRSAIRKSNRKLYISHNQIIIFSEEIAKQGIGEYMDFFYRDHETRYTVDMLISKGKTSDILALDSQLETMPAQDLSKLVKIQNLSSHAPKINIFEYAISQLKFGKTCLVPLVAIEEAKGEGPEAEKKKNFYIEGSGVIVAGKLKGELDEKETRGALWALDLVRSAVTELNVLGSGISCEVIRSKGDIKSRIESDGMLHVDISVNTKFSLGDIKKNPHVTGQRFLNMVNEENNKLIKDEIEMCIDKARELKADIFNTGDYLYRHSYKDWYKVKDNWEELYENAIWKVSVNSNCLLTGAELDRSIFD